MDHGHGNISSETSPAAPVSFRQRVLRVLFNAVFLTLFLAVMGGAVMLFLHRQWLAALALASFGLMSIPFADSNGSLREKVLVGIMMPFGLLGIVAGVVVYFLLFRFRWFESIFNDKGSGEFGLLIAVILGAPLGWYVGFRLVTLVFGPVNPSPKAGL